MERVAAILEREGDVLETLLFKLVEVRLLLEAEETRFLSRATSEVERARALAREVDLLRAATVARVQPGVTLRDLARGAPNPWPAILRDHHEVLVTRLAEIEVVAHRNSELARTGLEALSRTPVAAAAGQAEADDAELVRLARGASLDAVLGTAARLRMPDLVDFLR